MDFNALSFMTFPDISNTITPLHPVLQTLASLVRINSVNPAFDGGQPEGVIAAEIRRFFGSRGIESWDQMVFPGRPNVIARIPGRNPALRLILEAHMDTVSVAGMTIPPFEPEVKEGRMYGRGSCDTKAGLAAMMHAVADVHAAGTLPPCEIWLAAAIDEEYAFRGVARLCEGLSANAAIVAEPTELRAVIATKGVLRWRTRLEGRAVHSSKPHLGINAISHAARLVLELERENERLSGTVHPLLGPATCNVGIIHGGVQVNFVPADCAIDIDRRLLPSETAKSVLEKHSQLLDRLQSEHPGFNAVMEPPSVVDEALETRADAPPVLLASGLLRELGLNGELAGVPFGSDASKFSRQGIPSFVFGPGSIDRAHGAVEYVECDQVLQAYEFYRRYIQRFEPENRS
jgi:acetylornithine deacetylase/succinyl-diaminopimelate desuccinylase family protein